MQSTAWRELLARIPSKQHNLLMVVTAVGTEISVQELVRIQPEYLVVRGRQAGTSDAGRLFFVPFDQISFVGLLKMVLDQEVAEIFGNAPPIPTPEPRANPAEAVLPGDNVEQPLVAAEQPAGEEELVELSPRTAATPVKFPNRAELLERIKSRSQQGQGHKPLVK